MDFINEINEMVMSSEEDEENEENVVVRRPYRTFERSTVADFDDVDFYKYFRLRKNAFWRLHGMVCDTISGDTRRSRELTAEHKLLGVLRLLACGNFQQTAGDYIGISQPTMSRILPGVCDAILYYIGDIVYMPRTERECLMKATAFVNIAGFPRCIGAIDCTHVKISSPGGDISENFRNRHGFFSINVQTIADADLRIMNVVARWPGSTHDTVVFANSEVRQRLERGEFHGYVLIGDGGYANSEYLCTPFRAGAQLNDAQQKYQRSVDMHRVH